MDGEPVQDPPTENAEVKPVEEPVEEEKKEVIPEETLQDMQNLWRVFDRKNTDQIDISQLRKIMKALDFDLNPKELELVRQQIDPESTGFITFANLKLVMEDKLKEVDTYEDLIEQFKKLDKDGDGKIPAPEYKQYMKNLGQKMTQEQLDEMMEEADAKGEGAVDMETFGQRICPAKN